MSKIEMYFNYNDKVFRFPILPPSLMRDLNTNFDKEIIQGLGEVAVFNNNALSEITIDAFFPADDFPYSEYPNFPSASECVEYFGIIRQRGDKGRFIFTGGFRNLNQEMYIESFSYGEESNKGISYSMKLIEARNIELPTVTPTTNNNTNVNNPRPTTPTTTSKTHKVVKGDSLWSIAQKYYGNGSKYPQIKDKNKSKYPSLGKNNIIYSGWVLTL